jgi:LSD1 subclass zinc finger protein
VNCGLCERPSPAAANWPYLCRECALDTRERLEALPGIFDQLAEMLGPGGRATDGTRRGGPMLYSPTPDLDVIERRFGFAVLPPWHNALCDAMGRPAPVVTGELGVRMRAACTGLLQHMDWIAAEWIAAGDFAHEVKTLHGGAITVVGEPDLVTRMGPCPAMRDGVPCGAPLRLPDGQQVIRCGWCKATYPPGVWLALKREQAAVESDAAA